MKSYYPKNLYDVFTNDREHIIVKSNPDTLEYMVKFDMIKGWRGITIKKYDHRALYIELIRDYDPYIDLKEHNKLSDSSMLYNLKNLLDDLKCLMDFSDYTEHSVKLYERCYDLINLFKTLGIESN